MINAVKGNLLDNVTSGHIIHGCNAQGVMGSGIALAIRNKWPKVYDDYMHEHITNGLKMGEAYPVQVSDELFVWNCITQKYYGNDGRKYVSYDAIDSCMAEINENLPKALIVPEVNFPLMGAGLGGGKWDIIEHIIDTNITNGEKYLWIL